MTGDAFALPGWLLNDLTRSGAFSEPEILYPGTDSNTGCGANSEYYVTWSIHRANLAP